MPPTSIELIRDVRTGLLAPGVLELSGATLPREVESDGTWLKMLKGNPENAVSIPTNPPQGMLDDFIRLSQGASIEKYVLKWGALGICKHGFPADHDGEGLRLRFNNGLEPDLLPSGTEYTLASRVRRGSCRNEWISSDEIFLEPVERYIYFARQAHAILTLAAELQLDRPGGEKEWSRVWHGVPPSQFVRSSSSSGNDEANLRWMIVTGAINEWMQLGNVSPALVWTETSPQFRLDASPFGTLGIQMMFAVTAQRGLAICSECANPYMRTKRMPKKGQNNYCETCGDQARWRSSKRKKARQGD